MLKKSELAAPLCDISLIVSFRTIWQHDLQAGGAQGYGVPCWLG